MKQMVQSAIIAIRKHPLLYKCGRKLLDAFPFLRVLLIRLIYGNTVPLYRQYKPTHLSTNAHAQRVMDILSMPANPKTCRKYHENCD